MLTFLILSKALEKFCNLNQQLEFALPTSNVFTVAMLLSQLLAYALFVWLPITKKGRNVCVTVGQTFTIVAIVLTFVVNLIFGLVATSLQNDHRAKVNSSEATSVEKIDSYVLTGVQFISMASGREVANMFIDSYFYISVLIVWMGLLCMRNKDKNAQSEDDIDSRREGDALLAAERGQCRTAYGADAYANATANNKVSLV